MKICICGGGNIAHVLVGLLGGRADLEIRLLTRQPALWMDAVKEPIKVVDESGRVTTGCPATVSSNPEQVIPGADFIFLALPAYARSAVLQQIAAHISAKAWIGSFPGIGGFDWMTGKHLDIEGKDITVFGSQRVPYISRIIRYGKEVFGSPKKEGIVIAVRPKKNRDASLILLRQILGMEVQPLNNFLEITLATSNPVLHPARMYALFCDYEAGRLWDRKILFYEEWNLAASEMLVRMDREVHEVIGRIPLDLSGVRPLLTHYGVHNAQQLTDKISGIPAFKNIPAPMVESGGGFKPDFDSRYFTEDIPFGLLIIKGVAVIAGVETPAIDTVLTWAQRMMGKEYLVAGALTGKDVAETPIPQNWGLHSMEELVRNAI